MEFVYLLVSEDETIFKIGKSSDYNLKRVDELSRNWRFNFFKSYIVATENSNGLEKTLHYMFQDYRVELSPIHNGFTEFFKIECFNEVFSFCKSIENRFNTSKVKLYKIADYRKHSERDIDMIEKINTEYTDSIKSIIKFKENKDTEIIKTNLQPMNFKIHHSIIEMIDKTETNNSNKLLNYILFKMYINKTNSIILTYRDLSHIFKCNTKDLDSGKYDSLINSLSNSLKDLIVNTSILKDDVNCFKDRLKLFTDISIKKENCSYELSDGTEIELFKISGVYFEINSEIKQYLFDNNGVNIDYSHLDLLNDKTSINLFKLYSLLKEEDRLHTLLPLKDVLKILGIKNDSNLKELHNKFILPAAKNILEKLNIELNIKYYGTERDSYIKIF